MQKVQLCYAILLHIGSIVAVVVFVFSVWRLGKAHKRIAETLDEHFLGGSTPPPRPRTDCPAPCLSCGRKIPAGETRCPRCGWSYDDSPNETVDRLKREGKL